MSRAKRVMQYLFGDSTEAPFTSNVLEFLRDAIDFAVYVLEADQRIRAGKDRIESLRRQSDIELDEIEALNRAVATTIETTPKGAANSPAAQCAVRMMSVCDDTARATSTSVRERLASDIHQAEVEEASERDGCLKALMLLLIPHPPPNSTAALKLELRDSGLYDAWVEGDCPGLGLTWKCELGFPERHIFKNMLRIESLWPSFEISGPELTGWLKKEVKMRPQRIERHSVTELVADGSKITISVRSERDDAAGFDFDWNPVDGVVAAERIAAADDPASGGFDLAEADIPKLIELCRTLQASLGELRSIRLVEAKLGDSDFRSLPYFSASVTKLVEQLSPMVREIATHSLEPNELILRRPLADDRREEIFVSKATLREKNEGLPAEQRRLFEPLELHMPVSRSLAPPAQPPPPPVEKRSELRQSTRPKPPPKPVAPVVVPSLSSAKLPSAEPAKASSSNDEVSDADWALDQPSAGSNQNPQKNEVLIAALGKIVALAKEGKPSEAYREYADLLDSPVFTDYEPEDQRRALKLLVLLGKSAAVADALRKVPPEESRQAHRAARDRAQGLIQRTGDAADYELLGLCQVSLDEPAAASETFRKGLEIEQARNPQSDLCGRLTKRVSAMT